MVRGVVPSSVSLQYSGSQNADAVWVAVVASFTQAWAEGVQGDGPGTEGSISASLGRALRLGMPGPWRPERTLLSVQQGWPWDHPLPAPQGLRRTWCWVSGITVPDRGSKWSVSQPQGQTPEPEPQVGKVGTQCPVGTREEPRPAMKGREQPHRAFTHCGPTLIPDNALKVDHLTHSQEDQQPQILGSQGQPVLHTGAWSSWWHPSGQFCQSCALLAASTVDILLSSLLGCPLCTSGSLPGSSSPSLHCAPGFTSVPTPTSC